MTYSHPRPHFHRPLVLCSLLVVFAGKILALHDGRETNPVGSSTSVQPGEVSALSYDLAFTKKEFLWDEAPVLTSDGSRVAYSVRLPPGRHRVTFLYRPLSVLTGAAAGLFGLCAAAVMLLIGRRRACGGWAA